MPNNDYLTDCGRVGCHGNGAYMLGGHDLVECPACGEYATIRQIQYLVAHGYVVYLNLATTRFEVQRRIGTGTDGVTESYGSVIEAIADLVLGVDLPTSPVSPPGNDAREPETAPPTPAGRASESSTARATSPVAPLSTPPVVPDGRYVAVGDDTKTRGRS